MGAYWLLAKKAFRRNMQYRASHMVNNAASAIFGFIYIAVWQAAARNAGAGEYTAAVMARWVAFTQVMLWLAVFLPHGLGIPEAVRTGAVSLEMLRPVDFHLLVISRELGTVWYNAWFRSLPLALVFALAVGVHVPQRPATYPLLACAVLLSVYLGLCQQYLVGISSFWTVQARWAWQLVNTCQMVLSGFMVPIDLLPPPFSYLARALPFAPLLYDPARIYLELSGAEALTWPAIWAVLLTLICRSLTAKARRRLEVQGG
jgi:ABC-type uncharacterized transport system, permease component